MKQIHSQVSYQHNHQHNKQNESFDDVIKVQDNLYNRHTLILLY